MSGFDRHWLALREPADHAARDDGLVEALARHLDGQSNAMVLDIGCGTGSSWRSLAPRLPAGTRWLMLDNDPSLLQEATRTIGPRQGVAFGRHDLNDMEGLPLDAVHIVTASALFDLCSERFCVALADRLVSARCGLYAALNYDGTMRWSHAHPLDERMVELFNSHQRTDKGFGEALGPEATATLARHLAERGFSIATGDSPWRMHAASADLQSAFLAGMRLPLLEISGMAADAIDEWLDFRQAAIAWPGSSCVVGHTDILALPA